jgi:hypothetical protein
MFETSEVNIVLYADREERAGKPSVERVSFGVMPQRHLLSFSVKQAAKTPIPACLNFEASEVNIALNADREERAGRPSVERVSFGVMHATAFSLMFGQTDRKNAYFRWAIWKFQGRRTLRPALLATFVKA